MTMSSEEKEALGRSECANKPARPGGPIILVLIGTYLPGYKAGGPIRSVENLVRVLGREFHFRIVTLDRDDGDKSPYPNIVVNRWLPVGDAEVMYLRPGLRSLMHLYTLLRLLDRDTVLYLNSFFSRVFSMFPVLMRWLNLCRVKCLVLAPRGEFSPGALRLKPIRKSVYIRISQWFGLYDYILWHASSNFEENDILRQFRLLLQVANANVIPSLIASEEALQKRQIAVALDIAGFVPTEREQQRLKMPGRLRVVFVSRLSRKKNLAGALQMLRGLSGDVSFDIYGPKEDAVYWKECQGLIAALPVNIQARYCGQIEHAKIHQVFADHDLFLFPTLGENYGHVVFEAFVSACPVLISDQTPWRGLEALKVGWDLPLSEPERFREVLQQCVDMGSEEHSAMCVHAAEFGIRCINSPDAIEANRKLFRRALRMATSQ